MSNKIRFKLKKYLAIALVAGIGFSSTTIGVLAYDDPYDVPKFTQEEINAEMNKLNNMTQDEIDAE